MRSWGKRLEGAAFRVLSRADAFMNRLYTWRFNPLYHSGALVVVLFIAVTVTGIYLLFFYRVSAPYQSIARLQDQVWLGRWIRSFHRYASDAAVVAALVHAFRVFAQGRSWGPRTLAWVSGVALLSVTLICGWTGYVMVWDEQGLVLAREGARFLDALPLFSEPISRAFVGDRLIPNAFFFLNLFLHVALPIGIGVVLWLHVSRVARAALLPPRALSWAVLGLLLGLSVLWPAALGPAADLFRLPQRAPFDLFYSGWLPLTRNLSAGLVWLVGGTLAAIFVATPWWIGGRSRRVESMQPSVVNQRTCDACRTCYLDCPYEAIDMVVRTDGRPGLVARVDPALCVSCGICAGSCAPMGVGPPKRTGRYQVAAVEQFIADHTLGSDDIVIIGCSSGAGNITRGTTFDGACIFPVDCAGSMHTSVVEYLVRSGVGGVLIVSCPPRDCWHREGPKWLEQRLYHGREAELKERVDRRRIRLAHAGLAEPYLVRQVLAEFRRELAALEVASAEEDIALSIECAAPVEEVES